MRAAMSTAGEMPEEGGQLFGSVRQPTPMTGAANSRRRPRTEKTNPATSARERNPKPNIQRSRHRPQVRARCRKGRPAAPGARPPAYRPARTIPDQPSRYRLSRNAAGRPTPQENPSADSRLRIGSDRLTLAKLPKILRRCNDSITPRLSPRQPRRFVELFMREATFTITPFPQELHNALECEMDVIGQKLRAAVKVPVFRGRP